MDNRTVTPFELWSQRRNRARNWLRDGRIVRGYPTTDDGPMFPPDDSPRTQMDDVAVVAEQNIRPAPPEMISMFDESPL